MLFLYEADEGVLDWSVVGVHAYVLAIRRRNVNVAPLAIAFVVALASVAVFLPPIYRALRNSSPKLVAPVIVYVAVFVVMVASAGGTGSLVGLGGAIMHFF